MFDYDVIKDAYMTGALETAKGVLKKNIKTGKELPSQEMKLYLVLLSDRSMCLGYYDNNSWWEFRNFPEKIDVVKWWDFDLFELWK